MRSDPRDSACDSVPGMRPVRHAAIAALVLAFGCAAGPPSVSPASLESPPTSALVMSYEKMMAQDLGPVPAITVGFPVQLDDAALLKMYERRQDFANAGSFDTYGTLPLTVVRGNVVRLHGGARQVFAEGEGLLLGRLDVLRVPAAATLTHTVLEAMLPAAYFEIRLRFVNVPTAWKSEDAYLMMHRFNGGSAHPAAPV